MCFKNAIFLNCEKMHFKNVKNVKNVFLKKFEVLFSYVLLLVVIVLL